jgi:NIMA (never in mitosis gene a)-related kinase
MSEGHYREIRLLGEGAFGKCYLCECLADHTFVAIKQIDLHSQSEAERKEALKEAKILEAFDHPNIIKFREVYKTRSGKLCIVMDYADGGDVSTQIKNQRGRYFTEAQVLDWFVQVCLAMKHVHDRKVLHRDIKSQNVFLTKAGIVKLGDFGIARVLSNTREIARTMVGTPYYLSPELVQNKPYSFKSDIWSLGVMLYELCTLKPPFDANSLHNLALKIVKGTYPPIPPQFSKDMKLLVAQMLSTDPNKRPTINQVLRTSVMSGRIRNCLTESRREQEFQHTVLHNQNLFGLKKAPEQAKRPEEPPRNVPPARDGARPPPKEPAKKPAFEAALGKPPSREEEVKAKNYHYQQKAAAAAPPEREEQIHALLNILKGQERPSSQAEARAKKPEPVPEPPKPKVDPPRPKPEPPKPAYKKPEPSWEPVYQAYAPKPQARNDPEAYRPREPPREAPRQYREAKAVEPDFFPLPAPRYDPLPAPRYDPPRPKPTPNLYVPPNERAGYVPPSAPKPAPDLNAKKIYLEQKRREAEMEEEKHRKKEVVDQRRDELKQKRIEERKKMRDDIMRKARQKRSAGAVQWAGPVAPEGQNPSRGSLGTAQAVAPEPYERQQSQPEVIGEAALQEAIDELEPRDDVEEEDEDSDIFAHASSEEESEPPSVLEDPQTDIDRAAAFEIPPPDLEEIKEIESPPATREERTRMVEDIRKRKKDLRESKRRGEVVIDWGGGNIEEANAANERQAVLYEMQEFLLADEESEEAPTEPLVPQDVADEEDREDDIIESNTSMFQPAPAPPETLPLVEPKGEGSTFNTLESIREYLETKLGVEVVVAAHRVVSEVGMSGDDAADLARIHEQLKDLLPLETLQRYFFFFQTMAIIENTTF